MEQTQINRIKIVVGGILGISPEAIKESDHIVDDLGADSLDEVEISIELELAFDIEIYDSELNACGKTVQELNALITKKVGFNE